MSDKLIAEAAM